MVEYSISAGPQANLPIKLAYVDKVDHWSNAKDVDRSVRRHRKCIKKIQNIRTIDLCRY